MHYKMDDESPKPFSINDIFLLLLILSCVIIVHDFYSTLRYALQISICFFFSVWKIWSEKCKTKSSSSTTSADQLQTQKSCNNKHVGDKKVWRKMEMAKGKGKVPMHKLHNDSRNVDEEDEKLGIGEIKVMMEKLESLCDEEDGDEEMICELFEEEVRDEEVKEAFDVFDENNDGLLDAGEIKRSLCGLGFMDASEMECKRMIKAFDRNGDGLIDFKEFSQLMEQSFSN